ncbi:MAG: undecaprenyl/decaprenyl-phosphate alpha-N-acetylglucosaminyl 1-phosphate transferase [Actinomycetota bacterium]|nr:undecaprenyl/decaprenyl-phosphate alpha-N-acetylglucosaminyl 1-phosphate transferase [Actinomycetota bacterium]
MNELDALWALLVAGAAALVLTPLAARMARRAGAVATPRDRDLHESPTPRMGGLAILAGVLLAGALFLPGGRETRGILIGAAVAALFGALDDKFDLPPSIKLAGQLLAAAIPVASEVYVENVTLPFVDPLDLGDFGMPLTLLGIVATMNVVNFTDGADGLAAGVCTIAAVTFAIIALSLGRDEAGILAALTAGAAAGFLWHNFHPASVFMGDSGSNLLGLLLAAVAIQGVLKTAAVVALFFPLVILAVPALDATFVVAKRIKYRKPVYSADRWHFHHRFANIGFSQRKTVLYLYAWTLSLAALALALRFVPYSDDSGQLNAGWTAVILAFAAVALAASIYLVVVLEILKFRRFRERQLRRASETGEMEALSEPEIRAEIEREVETGEFEAV